MKSRIKKGHWLLEKPVAHRGLHNKEFGENSLSAYKNAIDKGYPIEMDVQLSKDGVLFCYHDDFMERVTGKKANINDLTAEEIKQLKILNTKDGVPTFEEFLALVDGKVPLMIEIKQQKSKQYDIAKMTVDALKDYKGEYVVQSFDPFIMQKVRKYAPHILRGQLGGLEDRGNLPFATYFVVKHMCLNFLSKPDYINYYLKGKKRKGKKPMVVWTVRTEEDLKLAKQKGVNFVFESVNVE